MFFTTANGSFRLKGSGGRTDLFEIGSAGPSNDGRLEFIIGDDGSEPIVLNDMTIEMVVFIRSFLGCKVATELQMQNQDLALI